MFEKPLGRNNTQISCTCANNTDRGTMVQCEVGSSTCAPSHVDAGCWVSFCIVMGCRVLCSLGYGGHSILLSSCICQLQADACGIWQHCSCVGIDANAMPEHYFCQSCRIAMADPFWQAESIQLIPPAMLRSVPGRPVVIRSSGKDQAMAVDRAFDLSAAQLEPLRKNTHTEQLHVSLPNQVCMLEARLQDMLALHVEVASMRQ